MPPKQNFPADIRNALIQVSKDAKTTHYGVSFIHTDDGEPTASLGRLSGGLCCLGVYDDFIVGLEDGLWAVWSSRGNLIGRYGHAGTLRAGLTNAIGALYCKRMRRGRQRMA